MEKQKPKVYQKIGTSRLLDIEVILDENDVLYRGMVEDAPQQIKEMWYSKIDVGTPMKYYVYSDVCYGEKS